METALVGEAPPTGLDEETAVAMYAAGEQGARQWIRQGQWLSSLYSLFAVDHNI